MSAKYMNQTDSSDVDKYLDALPDEQRRALVKLRKLIKSIVPDAEEVISYQVPAFRYHGSLVAYAALPNHCSLFVMSPAIMDKFKKELSSYNTSKGTIRFSPGNPLPDALVRKIVKARISENQNRKKLNKQGA